MRRLGVVAGCMAVFLLTSCTSMKAHVMARAVTDGLYSIESYRARTIERGLLRRQPGVPIVKSVFYERPWKVRAEVVAPAEHAGETFVFDGATVSIWWPHSGIGLRITGIEEHDRREVAQVILEDSYWILGNYKPVHEGSGRIAGRSVEHWRCEPLGDNPLVGPYDAWMDAELSVPLGVSLRHASGAERYGMEFEAIELGAAVGPEAFRFEFPEGAVVFDCDLAAPGISLDEARDLVEFTLFEPRKLPAGHSVRKIVLGGDPEAAPMIVSLMPKGARWLSLTQTRNTGPAVVPDVGIRVHLGAEHGVLNFAFGFTILSWSSDNTALTLIGNLPYPEMLALAASVEPAKHPAR